MVSKERYEFINNSTRKGKINSLITLQDEHANRESEYLQIATIKTSKCMQKVLNLMCNQNNE